MDTKTLLQGLFKGSHDALEGTMQGVTDEMTAHWKPAGKAIPVGAQYAHILLGEDVLLCTIAAGRAPLVASSFAGKVGLSALPPEAGDNWAEWATSVKVDLDALRAYGQAVYAQTAEYIAGLSDADLDRMVSVFGSDVPVATFLTNFLGTHIAWHTGEISSVKGEQGLQGYPF